MRVVTVNYHFDTDLGSPDDLLDRYRTLTGWAEGLAHAGADVTVVQRFSRDADLERTGIRYRFVHGGNQRPRPLDTGGRVNAAVATLKPDVVHINGLQFARQAWCLKRLLPRTPLVLQDHADHPPRRPLSRAVMKTAMTCAQGVSFAAADIARPWIDAGIIRADMPIFELMEGSTNFRLWDSSPGEDRAETSSAPTISHGYSREPTGALPASTGPQGADTLSHGSSRGPAGALPASEGAHGADSSAAPMCLWVGRLDENKDPLTVLRGFASALHSLPSARLTIVYEEAPLLPQVREWLAANPSVAGRVTLIGSRPHAEMEALYNSARFLLLGSHHESAGYAVIEALACGVVPIVTNIPSFRVLLDQGRFGGLWPVGNSEALAHTLLEWNARWRPDTPRETRTHFDANWSFDAIGRKAMAAYGSLIYRR